MKFDAIQIHSAPEALVQQIEARINKGELKPGSMLPSQRQLAKMFNVGLGTVREAIKILSVMGNIKVVRGKGTFIADGSVTAGAQGSSLDKALEAVSLADLMKAREIVECEAAFLAARETDTDHIKRLRRIDNDMQKPFTNASTFYHLDFDFHISIAEASNNKAILEIVKLLVDKAHNHIGFMETSLGISMPLNAEKAVETARKVIHCIAEGDGENARLEMSSHLNIVIWELQRQFPA